MWAGVAIGSNGRINRGQLRLESRRGDVEKGAYLDRQKSASGVEQRLTQERRWTDSCDSVRSGGTLYMQDYGGRRRANGD